MKKLAVLGLLALAASCVAAELKLGKPLALKEPVSIEALLAKPEGYVDKTVQVKGKVTEVCQMMGCWMMIADPKSGKAVRIKVNDGEIEFPKNAPGRLAIAEGKFVKRELTREQAVAQARHEAEEQGKTFDESKIKSGATVYQIQGTGAVLLD